MDRPVPRDLVRDALADARAMNRRARGGPSRSGGGRAGGASAADDGPDQGMDPRKRRRRRQNLAANTRRPGWSDSGWTGAGRDARDPQSAGSVVGALFTERGWHRPVAEARVFADWAGLVGADIAGHCQPTALAAGELRVSAGSSAWATQIRLLAPTLLARLAGELGAGVVSSLAVSGPTGPTWKHGRRSVPGARGPRDTYG